MATHSGVLAWSVPWTEEPGGLQSMGSHRAGHDWVTKHARYFISEEKEAENTPVSCPGVKASSFD